MAGTPVTLTAGELLIAVTEGVARFHQARALGLDPANARTRDLPTQLLDEAVGVCGELAWCKAMGRPWLPQLNAFHRIPDEGTATEVRTTRHRNGHLIVRPGDHIRGRWFVLVTGYPPRFIVRGWIPGEQVKAHSIYHPPDRTHPAGSWWVPQSALTPPSHMRAAGIT